MPLGAPSISKYSSLVRPDAQIVALRAQCARSARALRLRLPQCYQMILEETLRVKDIFFVQTKMSWRRLLTVWYSRQPLGIKVQSCPVLQ